MVAENDVDHQSEKKREAAGGREREREWRNEEKKEAGYLRLGESLSELRNAEWRSDFYPLLMYVTIGVRGWEKG
jgi:hypothetical protein